MFTEKENLKLKIFLQSIIFSLRFLDKQPSIQKDGFVWCEDWEIIEICKCLFNGEVAYIGDPPPNRLKNNPLWSKEDIIQKAKQLINDYKDVDKIIEYLGSKRNVT
jgi:hypothetical protein